MERISLFKMSGTQAWINFEAKLSLWASNVEGDPPQSPARFDFVVIRPLNRWLEALTRRPAIDMQFSFMVGITEPHRVDFSFDQFGGRLEIKVDGLPIVDEVRTLSASLTKRYDFVVGVAEKHHVTIEKERKLLLAGLQPQKYRIFIDGQLVQTYEG